MVLRVSCVALLHDCIEDAEYPEESDKYISQHFPDLFMKVLNYLHIIV